MNTERKINKKDIIVSIACLIFVLMILGAVGEGGRRSAKEKLCMANLSQWGRVFIAFSNDNNGYLHQGWRSSGGTSDPQWWDSTYNYYKDWNLLFCPVAILPLNSEQNAPQGSSDRAWGGAWGLAWHQTPIPGVIPDGTVYGPYNRQNGYYYPKGSYGNNEWVCDKKTPNTGGYPKYSDDTRYWRTIHVRGGDKVPSIGDAAWFAFSPQGDDNNLEGPPAYKDDPLVFPNEFARVCIDRHNGVNEWLFLDSSVRPVGIKELWTLKWHRNYEPKQSIYVWSHYTSPQNPVALWPDWMKDFAEYTEK